MLAAVSKELVRHGAVEGVANVAHKKHLAGVKLRLLNPTPGGMGYRLNAAWDTNGQLVGQEKLSSAANIDSESSFESKAPPILIDHNGPRILSQW